MGRKQVRCHGDAGRFEAVAGFIYEKFRNSVKYIADAAGGQGCLSRLLNKKYNYVSEVIDPRGYALKGVPARQCAYAPEMAGYYDLIVGLHPDEATRAVAESALYKPTLLVPCCNFWDTTQKLSHSELMGALCGFYKENGIPYEIVEFDFSKPKNVGIITERRASPCVSKQSG